MKDLVLLVSEDSVPDGVDVCFNSEPKQTTEASGESSRGYSVSQRENGCKQASSFSYLNYHQDPIHGMVLFMSRVGPSLQVVL